MPPQIIPTKDVVPKEIWAKDSGKVPNTATVTLRVNAVGDPVIHYQPVDVVLVFHTSPTMEFLYPSYTGTMSRLVVAEQSAINFLSRLHLNGNDRAAVISFNGAEGVQLRLPFTNDSTALIDTIARLTIGAATVLYDATDVAVTYANNNHWPVGHLHPHPPNPRPVDHHDPYVIIFSDGITNSDKNYTDDTAGLANLCQFVNQSHQIYNTTVYTVGIGDGQDFSSTNLTSIAQNGSGMYYGGATPNQFNAILQNISLNITHDCHNFSAAIEPSPTESMITDVLPPEIIYQAGSYKPTSNNNATIQSFRQVQGLGGMWELRWDVPMMKIHDVFEVQYNISCDVPGWHSAGVNIVNATYAGSDWCRVKYLNYQYYRTGNASDVWTNDTPDVSIFVKEPVMPDLPVIIVPAISMMAIFIIIRRKR